MLSEALERIGPQSEEALDQCRTPIIFHIPPNPAMLLGCVYQIRNGLSLPAAPQEYRHRVESELRQEAHTLGVVNEGLFSGAELRIMVDTVRKLHGINP